MLNCPFQKKTTTTFYLEITVLVNKFIRHDMLLSVLLIELQYMLQICKFVFL